MFGDIYISCAGVILKPLPYLMECYLFHPFAGMEYRGGDIPMGYITISMGSRLMWIEVPTLCLNSIIGVLKSINRKNIPKTSNRG